MNNQTWLFRNKIIFVSIFFLISISMVQSFDLLLKPVNASTTNNIKADNNSTFSKSDSNKENNEIGMTIVIPNAGSNSNATTTKTTTPPTGKATSEPPSKENETLAQPQKNNLSSSSANEETIKPSINSNQPNTLQRGEYKVDENGIHYYNINNCSEAKGSSGIGDLSECEDAEREMREEM